MLSFRDYYTNIFEGGGQAPGKMELLSTPLEKARQYAIDEFNKYGRDFFKDMPDFDSNYKKAQNKAKFGWTKRKDMPVINDGDVKEFQQRLKEGYIDIKKPFGSVRKKHGENPFPEGLSGERASEWLESGLAIHDGSDKDDRVKVTMERVSVGDLKPIQAQIYVDKCIPNIANFGVPGTKKFLRSTFFIASSDLYIIDGHHRFLSGMMIDPSMKVKVLTIDLPIKTLLPVSLAYGDAIGNQRNL